MKEIIRFKGYNYSNSNKDNFLFNIDHYYIMDNHRLALWCWLQKIKSPQVYNFLHVDYHCDTSLRGLEDINKQLPSNLFSDNLDKYRNFEFLAFDKRTKLFISWDNYISIFNEFHSSSIKNYFFYVMERGSENNKIHPEFLNLNQNNNFNSVDNYDDYLQYKWIINIDLDFFFLNNENEPYKSNMKDIINNLAQKILFLDKKSMIEVITIALSPDLRKPNNGWNQSIDYLKLFEKELGKKFSEYIF